LLKIVQRSDKENSHGPSGLRAGIVIYVLGGIHGSNGRNACINFEKGSFDWKLKVLVHFLRVKRDWRANSSLILHTLISSNLSDEKFEIAIFLKKVQRSYSKNSGVHKSFRAQGQAL